MTAVPPPVPPEIVERLRLAISDPGHFVKRGERHTEPISSWQARAVLAAVHGDIVEAARRDALVGAIEAVEAMDPDDDGNGWGAAIGAALETLTDLLTATAPPRAPTASVSDQGADPRTPTTPEAVSGHSGPREEDDA